MLIVIILSILAPFFTMNFYNVDYMKVHYTQSTLNNGGSTFKIYLFGVVLLSVSALMSVGDFIKYAFSRDKNFLFQNILYIFIFYSVVSLSALFLMKNKKKHIKLFFGNAVTGWCPTMMAFHYLLALEQSSLQLAISFSVTCFLLFTALLVLIVKNLEIVKQVPFDQEPNRK